MLSMFDKWVIVEGFSKNGGSTSWCNNLHFSANSFDHTVEFLIELKSRYPEKVILEIPTKPWKSKDEQVNKCIELLKGYENNWLWQIDIDEQWNLCDLINAENSLEKNDNLCGAFQFTHYLCKNDFGQQLIGVGKWGSNYNNRLWWWTGGKFISHEPPIMENQKKIIYLNQKYNHYSYYFEEDIIFKAKYYKGYNQLFINWNKLKKQKYDFPISVKHLLGTSTKVDYKNSYIDVLQ